MFLVYQHFAYCNFFVFSILLQRERQPPGLDAVLSIRHIIFLNFLSVICKMNISRSHVLVISPKLHGASHLTHARIGEVSLRAVAFWKKVVLVKSSTSFLPLHILGSSSTFSGHSVTRGNLSLNCFLAASPSDKYITLTKFLL